LTKRILLVDDEADVASAMRLYLEEELDVKVETVKSSRLGLELLHERPFDLILVDFRMPGMTGLELLRRAKDLWPEVPRVMITAHPDPRLAKAAETEGKAARFLGKPIAPPDLAAVVVEVAGARRRR